MLTISWGSFHLSTQSYYFKFEKQFSCSVRAWYIFLNQKVDFSLIRNIGVEISYRLSPLQDSAAVTVSITM